MLDNGHQNFLETGESTRHSAWWKVGAFLFALGGVGSLTLATLFTFRFTLFSLALASGPSSNRVLNYQIRLTDPSGVPTADGTKNLKISFYDAATGGTTLHTDCGTTGTPVARKVVFTGGIGTVLIGETTADGSHNCADASAPNVLPATLFNATSLFLGITVEADAEMTPRKRIVATGFSLNADRLDDLETSAIGGAVAFVPVTDVSGNLVLTQNLTVDGTTLFVDATNNRVGVGTVSADKTLTVSGDISAVGSFSAGAGVDFFATDLNQTIAAGANNQVISLLRLRHRGSDGAFTGVQRPLLISENVGGGQHRIQLFETGLRVGPYFSTPQIVTPAANIELDGFGDTSATFSMQVQNSAGTDVFAIRDDGNVGIRTFSPATALDLSGALSVREMAAPALSPTDQGRLYFDATSNKFRVSENGAAYVDLVSAAAASGWTDDGAVVRLTTATDNVGIGTASAAQKLVVKGQTRVGESSDTFDDFGSPYQLVINADRTDTSGFIFGTHSRLYENPASASTAAAFALNGTVDLDGANNFGDATGVGATAEKLGTGNAVNMRAMNAFSFNNAGNVTNMFAIRSLNQTTGGTITNAYGLQYQMFANGGTTTNSYGVKIESPSTAGGVITNNYGIHIDPMTGGTTVNNAILYNHGTTPFVLTGAGNVGIGTAGPSTLLNVNAPVVSQGFVVAGRDAAFEVTKTHATSDGFFRAATIQSVWDLAASGSGTTGMEINAQTKPGNINNVTSVMTGSMSRAEHLGSGTASELVGAFGIAQNTGGGVVATAEGLFGAAQAVSTNITSGFGVVGRNTSRNSAIMTNSYGLYASNPSLLVGGTVTNSVGVVTDDLSVGTNNTNVLIGTTTVPAGNFSVYNASSYNNYFSGSLGIGTTAPSSFKLQVAGNVGPDADNTYDLGSASLRWKTLHVGPGSVVVHNDATDTAKMTLGFTGSTATITSNSGTPIDIRTGTTTAMAVASNGDVTFNGNVTTTKPITTSLSGHALGAGTRGLWKLDESSGTATASDAAGTYPLATVVGTPGVTTGKFGNARTFNGSSDVRGAADAGTVTQVKTGAWSIGMWFISTNSGTGLGKNLFAVMDASLNAPLHVKVAFNSIYAGSTDQGNGTGGGTINDNTWYHLVLTHAAGVGQGMDVYLNGSFVGHITVNDSALTPASPLFVIGGGPHDQFEGTIDDVFFENAVMTAGEVLADYNKASASALSVSGKATITGDLDLAGALTVSEMSAPSLSPADKGRIYFDATANKFRVSENGGAYVDLVSAGGGFVNGGNSFGGAATLGTNDNFGLNLETNNVSRVSVTNAGNVDIGSGDFHFDTTNRILGIGSSDPFNDDLDGTGAIYIQGAGATEYVGLSMFSAHTGFSPVTLGFFGSRGTVGAKTSVGFGDRLGVINFAGYDGANLVYGNSITAEVGGVVASGIVPGRMLFKVGDQSGTVGGVERLRIEATGSIGLTEQSPQAMLHLGPSGQLAFEGSSADLNETFLTVANPTADRTITFQDASGTVAFLSDLGGSAGGWTDDGTIVRLTTATDQVGIGTTTPASGVSLEIEDTTDLNSARELFSLHRSRSGLSAPDFNMTADLTWRLEGFTNNSDVLASRIRSNWNQAQIDDTTSRDSDMSFWTMTDNVLSQRMTISGFTGFVGIGTSGPNAPIETVNSGTISGVYSGAILRAFDTDSVGANGLGSQIEFQLEDNASNQQAQAVQIQAVWEDATAASLDASLRFITRQAGALTEAMRIDDNGTVGIGDTTPTNKLDVTGAIGISDTAVIDSSRRFFAANGAVGAGTLAYSFSADTNTGIYDNGGADDLRIVTSGSDRVAINGAGNVGIGDMSPDSLLDVLSSGAANTTLKITNTNAGDFDPVIGFEVAEGTHVFSMGVDDSNGDRFVISGGNTLGTNDLLTIHPATGNVGIGTSDSVNAKLSVDRTGAVTTSDFGASISDSTTSSTASINKSALLLNSTGTWNGVGAVNSGLRISNVTGGSSNYSIYSDSTADSYFAGSVGIGTASPTLAKLQVNATTGTGIRVDVSDQTALHATSNESSGVAFQFDPDALTTGYGMLIDGGSGVQTSGVSAEIRHNAFYNGSATVSGSVLSVLRQNIANSGAAITTSGPMVLFTEDNQIVSGSLVSTNDMFRIAENDATTGNTFHITSAGTGPIVRVEDDDGTFGNDTSPFVIDAGGSVGIGDATPDATFDIDQPAATSGSPKLAFWTGGAHTGLTASTEAIDVDLALNRTVQFATGSLTTQRAFVVRPPTYAFAGASTLNSASTMNITGMPVAGTNATITFASALMVGESALGSYDLSAASRGLGTVSMIPGISNGTGAANLRAGLWVTTSDGGLTLGNQTATLTDFNGLRVDDISLSSTTNVRTVTNAASLYVRGAPIAGTNVTITNGPYSIFVDKGLSRFDAEGGTVAVFNRETDDGTIISLQQGGTEQGSISVSGTTISYNAFTGSHYAWTDEQIEQGMLVRYTGQNRHLHGDEDSEMLYGIAPTASKNDPAVLGVYLALKEPSQPANDENPHLVMAVGNGDLWVVNEGENIETGDYLMSSDTPGHAMKDQGTEEVSHLIARAAEAVDWNAVTETVGGKKHKKISVTFVNFTRRSQPQTSELTISGNLDFKGYGIENVAFLRGMNGLWSIDESGKLVIQDIDARKVKTQELLVNTRETDKTVGRETILAGQIGKLVLNPKAKANSVVVVTFEGNVGTTWWVDEKNDGSFMVKLATPAVGDVNFVYWIIGVDGELGTPPPPPAPAPAPEPEPEPIQEPTPEQSPEPEPQPEPTPEPEPEPTPEPEPQPEPEP